MRSPLPTPCATFDRSAIMSRAWRIARADVAGQDRARRMFPDLPALTLRDAFARGLRQAWDEAKSARAYAVWAAEQDAAREARKALDVRTREIEELRFARVAAYGIDSTTRFLGAVTAIDSRLAELGAR